MKISVNGGETTILCQIPALRRAFGALGHEHHFDPLDPDVAFVFEGNAPYQYEQLARAKVKKTIFNVLDIPFHVPEVNSIIARYREILPLANRVTAISNTVARQVEEHCGVKCDTIYYPMKPVRHTGVKKYPYRVALVGRLQDANKRASLAVQALVRAGFKSEEVAIVGPEYLGWGAKVGLVSDETLNDIYNSVDYVMMLSKVEGIGLPATEGAVCGAIPIVAPDLTTFNEFWVGSPLGLHYQKLNSPDAVAGLIKAIETDVGWKDQLKHDFIEYGEREFRPKFEAVEVARRIISVYQSI